MTGDITRAITLVTYGNAFLKNNHDITALTLDHPSFKFENRVAFYTREKHIPNETTWILYAENPIEWLKRLKEEGCKAFRLVFEHDHPNKLNVQDHKLAAFVGGGGHRYIETCFSASLRFLEIKGSGYSA
jgi:hypothetical protein